MKAWLRSRRAPSREEVPPPEAVRPGRHEFDEVAPYYDVLMASVPYSMWVDYVETLIGQTGTQVGRVLDLACGTGKVGAELLRRGYQAAGVDLSVPMVRQCGMQQPPLPAAVTDATALGLRRGALDAVVCLYDSLNYLLEPEGLRRCFGRVAEGLREGGLFIFDMNTPRALRIGLFTQHNLFSQSPLHYRWVAHWEENERLCRVDMWFRWDGGGRPVEFRETHYQRAYEERQVREWLHEAGFGQVRSYEAFSLRPVSAVSDRMYFLAEKGSGR